MKSITLIAAALLLSAAPLATAVADDSTGGVAGHYQIRLRGLGVIPDASGVTYVGGSKIGGTLSATDSFEPELDATYFLTDHIGIEAIAAVTQHSVHQSVAGNVGSVWLLPPTVTVQYHFMPEAAFRPYVGAGINYTWFFSPKSALASPHYSDNVGFALQAGVDVPFGDGPYFLNFDVKKIFLKTTFTSTSSGGIVAHAALDPWIVGTGVGIRF